MWKESGINKYPEIMLHDCLITNIEKEGEDIIVDFGKYKKSFEKYGFWISDSEKNMSYRTGESQIIIKGYNDLLIKEIRKHQLSLPEGLLMDTIYDIKPECFMKNIHKGEWRFEVVKEFYEYRRALYIGKIRIKKKKQPTFGCCVQLDYKELVYLWNEVRYDHSISCK